MEHEHNQIIDNDGYFEVNATTRAIVNKTREKISIMQYDHNSECFTFKIPRYIENHDMLKCNAVEVHFKNGINADVYTVTDLRECPEDKNKIICSWLISDYATQYADFLIFSLKFKCVEEDGAVSYLWSTQEHTNIYINKSLDSIKQIIERYPNILEKLIAKDTVSSKEVILKHDSNRKYNTNDIIKVIDNFDNLVAFTATKDGVNAKLDYLPNERISTISEDNLLLSFTPEENNLTKSDNGTYLLNANGGILQSNFPLYFDSKKTTFDWGYDEKLDIKYLQCSTSGGGYQFRIRAEDAYNILNNKEVTFDFWAKFSGESSPHSERLIVITNDTTSAAAPANTQLKVEVNKVNDRWQFVVATYTDTAIRQQKMNVAFDKWNHFVISRKILKTSDGWSTINFTLWINGVHISTITLQEPESDPATTIYFGGNSGATTNQKFSGCIGTINIYNKVPTAYIEGWKQIDAIVDHKGYCSNYTYIVDLYKSKHKHENSEILEKIKDEMLYDGICRVKCTSEEDVAKLVDNPNYKAFHIELTTEGTTSYALSPLPPGSGIIGGTTTTTTRFYIFQDLNTFTWNSAAPNINLMGSSAYTQIKLSPDGLFKRTVTVSATAEPIYTYTEWESLHHTKAEIAGNYAPITLINDMQSQISKMVKPEYITNASFIFAGGVNADLLRTLNTEYIEVANSTFSENPNETIEFNAINCESMQHCFEGSRAVTIIFPNGTPKLIYADNICSKCESLTAVSGLDCTNATTLKYAFNGCAALEAVDLVSTAKVENLSYAFYGSALKTITGLDSSSVTHLDGAFAKSSIEALTLDCIKAESATGVFTECLSLSALTLKNLTTDDVAFEMFYSLPNTEAGTITLENCTINDDIKAIATEKGWLINE